MMFYDNRSVLLANGELMLLVVISSMDILSLIFCLTHLVT